MVYIKSDGSVSDGKPWGLSKIVDLFYSFIGFFVFFFCSLFGIGPSTSKDSRFGGSGFRGSGGSGGGGGGGGGGFGPGGGGGGPSKRFRTMGDINPPTVNAGGCPGGSCGM